MKIALVGDVMLGRYVNETLRARAPEEPWGDTVALIKMADWRICNLECAMADCGRPWTRTPKMFHFRSDAKNVAVLKAAGIDAVSLANNHALDYGYDALSAALENLSAAGIRQAGAGNNPEEARRLEYATVSGVSVGLIAFTDNQAEWEAGEAEQAGVYYVPVDAPDARTEALLNRVAEANEQVDLLVVSAHWGPNWGYRPPYSHVRLAHDLVDHGADIVFGHSPHVCRGIELYRNRPILYSAGDFVDDYAVDPNERNDRSFVFRVATTGTDILGLELFPTIIKDCRASRARGAERTAIVEKMVDLCHALETPTAWSDEEGCLRIGAAEASLRLS